MIYTFPPADTSPAGTSASDDTHAVAGGFFHTPEPWRVSLVGITNAGQRAIVSDAGRVALVDLHGDVKRGQGWQTACPIRDANARRIVAAVNACAGIPTEALERGKVALIGVTGWPE